MDTIIKRKHSKPKLQRRNAMKNIDYQVPSSLASSFDSSSSSLDFSPSLDKQSSLRVQGVDGEFELIFRSLGLSGPDDLSIPLPDWEAQRFRYNLAEKLPERKVEDDKVGKFESGVSVKKDFEESLGGGLLENKVGDEKGGKFESGVLKRRDFEENCGWEDQGYRCNYYLGDGLLENKVEDEKVGKFESGVLRRRDFWEDQGYRCNYLGDGLLENKVEDRELGEIGGGVLIRRDMEGKVERSGVSCEVKANRGIKGVRPPVLSTPPVKLAAVVDDGRALSTWDLVRSLSGGGGGVDNESPMSDGGVSVSVSSSGEENGGGGGDHGVVGEEEGESHSDVVGERVSGEVDESFYSVSPHGTFRRIFKSWQKGEILGKGSFGTVYEGFTDDGFFFAVKEVPLLDQGAQGQQSIFQLQQEIYLLSQFEHENIVRYLGTDKDKNMLYIFLELVKGSLARLYQKYRLKDSQVSAYTRQILSGLKYLHDRNVVHRDIKCANILVDTNGSVKLADFGLAKATTMNDVKSSKGSPYWMAPEVVNLQSRGYGLAADIWSLGCTVLEMLTRQPPYSHLEGMQALFRIGRGQPPPVPESLSIDARDFILKCLQVNPSKRPTAVQLLDHPFVKRPFLSPMSPASPHIKFQF